MLIAAERPANSATATTGTSHNGGSAKYNMRATPRPVPIEGVTSSQREGMITLLLNLK